MAAQDSHMAHQLAVITHIESVLTGTSIFSKVINEL